MAVVKKLKLNAVNQQVENSLSIAIRMLMEDVHNFSNPITPKSAPPLGGTLRASVTKTMVTPLLGVMKWHAPYAEYQERGYTTGPVTHYTTPGTHAHFVEQSVNRAMQNLPQYIKMGGLV